MEPVDKAALSEVTHNMTLHPPTDENIVEAMKHLRRGFQGLAADVIIAVPVSRERSMCLRSLEDALQYAIAGIARNQTAALAKYEDLKAIVLDMLDTAFKEAAGPDATVEVIRLDDLDNLPETDEVTYTETATVEVEESTDHPDAA